MTLTLDTNCLIDLEEKRAGFLAIKKIVEYPKIDVAVVAVSAIDKKVNGEKIDNFLKFQNWLTILNLNHLKILKPIAYTDISYCGWCVLGGGELTKLDHKIHNILFPKLPYSSPPIHSSKKWINAKADVLIMWAHIWNKREYFITRDKNFLKQGKKEKLEKLGNTKILTPEDFLKIFKI